MKIVEYECGGLRIRPAERELWQDDARLPVPRLAFDCIVYLIENRERAVGRDELVAAVWGRSEVSEGHLNQIILRARRVLGDGGNAQQMIRTVSGFGYRWVAPVVERQGPAALDNAVVDSADGVDAAEAALSSPLEPDPAPDPVPDAPPALASRATSTEVALPPGVAVRHRVLRTGIAAACVLAVVLLGLRLRSDAPAPPVEHSQGANPPAEASKAAGDVVAVLPLAVQGARETGWIGLGAMDLIAERLRSADLVVSPSETVITVLPGGGRTPTPEELAQIRRTLGAGVIVQGRAVESGRGWSVELTAQGSDGQRQQAQAQREDAIQAARAATDLLLAALGRQPPGGETTSDPLQERLQQAQAALLTGQLDLARSILVSMPRGGGSAVEVSYRLAEVDFRAGRLDQADDALAALAIDPQVQASPLRRARVLTLRGNVHYRRSEFEAAAADFDAAIAALGTVSAPVDLCDALTRRGTARTALGDLTGAATDLAQARVLAEQVGDRLRVAHVDASFGMLQIKLNRLELALPHIEAAIDQYEAFGAGDRVVTLLNALIDAYASLLRWREANAYSDRQWALRERVAEPGLMVIMANRRGRGLIALGQFATAEALLADLHTQHHDQRPGVLRYVHDLEADLAAERGQWPRAVAAAERALELWPRSPIYDRFAYLVLVRQRGLIAAGTATPAAIEPWLPDPAQDGVSAVFTMARAEWAAHRSDSAGAALFYAQALQAAEASGIPARIALVARSYGAWLLASGQRDAAAELAARVAVWARDDYGSALFRLAVFHALGRSDLWSEALERAQALAGERSIPADLQRAPATPSH